MLVKRRGELAVARTCEACFAVCPECYGVGYTFLRDERGYRYAHPCTLCGPVNRALELFNNARIPARYCEATLMSLASEDKLDPAHPILGNMPEIRTAIINWLNGFVPGDRGLLFHGEPGAGKTHAMVAILRELTLVKGVPCRFIEFSHLLGEIRSQYDHGRGGTTIVGPLVDTDVLAIDELGKGVDNEWQLSMLDELISKRYNNSKTTIFTSNYSLETTRFTNEDVQSDSFIRKAERIPLPERIGERIFSRLHEMAIFLEFHVPDYRRRHAMKRRTGLY